jgi:Transcriptional Coactivator p15 (PC4)
MENRENSPRAQVASDANRWVADVPKNSREVLRIQLTEFKGYELVNLRIFYRPDDGEDLRPGNKGFTLRVEKLLELRAAIDKAIERARADGLLP